MNFIARLSLVFLIAIGGGYGAVAGTNELATNAAHQPFKRPLVRCRPGADSPFVPHSSNSSSVDSAVSGEEDIAPGVAPLKKVRGGSTNGSAVLGEDATTGGSPIFGGLVEVEDVPVIDPKLKVSVDHSSRRSMLSPQQRARLNARKAHAAARVPVPALVPIFDAEPLVDVGPRIVAAALPVFRSAREVAEPAALLAVYNLTGNWILDKKGNYQISEVGCREKVATVFLNESGYGAYVSPAFMTDKRDLLDKHVRIAGALSLEKDPLSDITVANSTWDKIALLKTRFDSFEEGQAWVEQAIADLGISLEKKPT